MRRILFGIVVTSLVTSVWVAQPVRAHGTLGDAELTVVAQQIVGGRMTEEGFQRLRLDDAQIEALIFRVAVLYGMPEATGGIKSGSGGAGPDREVQPFGNPCDDFSPGSQRQCVEKDPTAGEWVAAYTYKTDRVVCDNDPGDEDYVFMYYANWNGRVSPDNIKWKWGHPWWWADLVFKFLHSNTLVGYNLLDRPAKMCIGNVRVWAVGGPGYVQSNLWVGHR